MARHYSTTHFFRQMPNALLERYFERRGVFLDIDFSAMSETNSVHSTNQARDAGSGSISKPKDRPSAHVTDQP